MVTTRLQSGSNSDPATDVSLALESLIEDVQSVGSKKRRRLQVADSSTSRGIQEDSDPTLTRKRQKLPGKDKDEQHIERHTHIAVEIPVRDIKQDNTPMWTVPDQAKSTGKGAPADDKSSNLGAEGKDNRKGKGLEDGHTLSSGAHEAVEKSISLPEASEKTLKGRGRGIDTGSRPNRIRTSSSDTAKVANTTEANKPKHMRFNSEEPSVEKFEQVTEVEGKAEEEDESSDDDAPEIVDTNDAQEKARVTARSATKAVEEQEAITRKKRKDRDIQLKKQAEAVNKKRKQADNSDEDLFTPVAVDAVESLENEEQQDPLGNTYSSFKSDLLHPSKSRTIITKSNIPEFLPTEYLEDGPDEENNSLPTVKQAMTHKSKKIKFIDAMPKKPKDRKRGSTIYRVAEPQGDGLLAPRAASNARSMKEAWLNGQRGPGKNMKVVKGGFFKSRR